VAVEVLTLRGLVTYYVLLFIHLASRRVAIAGNRMNDRQGRVSRLSAFGADVAQSAAAKCAI
jgi:hypothetical protein